MLKRVAVAMLAFAGAAHAQDITQSPPMTKGTAIAPDADDLPQRAATEPPPPLTPVMAEEVRGAMPSGVTCGFAGDGGDLLVAGADRAALAKPDGRLTTMLYEGPALRAGGYFTAGDITIVIEPDVGTVRTAPGGGSEWTASLIIDRAGRNVRHAGRWRCTG